MLIDTDTVIPLRWWHLTMGERIAVVDQMPDVYEPWEWENGYFVRDEHTGDINFVEDCQEH